MTDPAADPHVTHRWDGGLEWIANPDELMERTSHAIVGQRGVWLVDPLSFDGLTDVIDPLGEVAGIVVTLDRHTRDAESLADRYDVPVHLPAGLLSLRSSLDADTEPIQPFSEDTGFDSECVVDIPSWREYALRNPERGTVILGDAMGTAQYFLGGSERLGLHPALRPLPPRDALGAVAADRVLVGHGPGLMQDGVDAMNETLDGARRRAPRAYLRAIAAAGRNALDR